LTPFELNLRGRIVYGSGALGRLGEVVTALHRPKVLLVTDAGVTAAGIAPRAVEAARAAQPNVLVAVGGGSAIDTAKGVNLVEARFLPIVAVPTTAGT